MRSKFCLPLIIADQQKIRRTIKDNLNNYGYFEIWLDYITNLNDELVSELIKELGSKLVIVFRRKDLESMHLPKERRLEIIKLCAGTGVLVDLDIDSQKTEIDYIRKNNLAVSTIVSHHNYAKAPEDKELSRITRKILRTKPTILKIAVMCPDEHDALRLLRLLLDLKAKDQRCIILGMGPHGFITRIFGTLWGNEFIFAPLEAKDQTAPHQLTNQQLTKIFTILESKTGEYHGRQ